MKQIILFLFIISTTDYYANSSKKLLADCESDLVKHCPRLDKNSKKIQCLLENETKISQTCQSNLKSYQSNLKEQGNSECKDDVKNYCRWIVPGGGRIIKCLLINEDKLSLKCKNKLNSI